jgi:hypothetical protein
MERVKRHDEAEYKISTVFIQYYIAGEYEAGLDLNALLGRKITGTRIWSNRKPNNGCSPTV